MRGNEWDVWEGDEGKVCSLLRLFVLVMVFFHSYHSSILLTTHYIWMIHDDCTLH